MVSSKTGLVLCILLISAGSSPAMGYKIQKRIPYSNIGDQFADYMNDVQMKETKRQSPGGTCTCTCETKPINTRKSLSPSSPSSSHEGLNLRTATKPETRGKDHPKSYQQQQQQHNPNKFDYSKFLYNDVAEDEDASEGTVSESPTTTVEKADNSNWGHESRYPWKNLPETNCFRNECTNDRECCRSFSVCDKSSKTCTDCWFRMGCRSESDCCEKYPFCKRIKAGDDFGGCADEMV